jgi:hypothetical protein
MEALSKMIIATVDRGFSLRLLCGFWASVRKHLSLVVRG